MSIVIHHNPKCGTSRNTPEMIRASGMEPVIVEYLKTGWTKPQLQALFAAADLTPRTALREIRSPAEELGLLGEEVDDETILNAMIEHPELVYELLESVPASFTEKDSDVLNEPVK